MNFTGLVNLHSLPASEPLLPLYEAIVNSIQSIEDANLPDKGGFIDVYIKRTPQMTLIGGWETDIESIVVTDNGIGFTDENFTSFDTYASDFKVKKGCKGVGRIMWLKAFDIVEIDSIYSANGESFRRKFMFSAENSIHGEINEKIENVTSKNQITTVTLKKLKSNIRKATPKRIQTIARDILFHCFMYFVSNTMPKIRVFDDSDTICIHDLYNEYDDKHFKVDNFTLNNCLFSLIHSKNYKFPSSNATLNFCAHNRKVFSIKLSSILNNIEGRFHSDDGNFSYFGFIVAQILDETVNQERTEFSIPEEPALNLESNEIGLSEIRENARQLYRNFFERRYKQIY